jgi:hypothetical protein
MHDVTPAARTRRRPTPRRALAALVALALCAGALACTDDGGDGGGGQGQEASGERTVATIRDATAALGAVRIEGVARQGELEGPVSGTVAVDPGRGVVRLPVFVDGAAQEVELRWDGETVWIRRVPGAPLDPVDPAALFVRAPEARPWVALPTAGLASGLLLVPWDPFALLDTLSAARLRPAGEDEVGGETATRYDVDGATGLVTAVRLWVDGDGRLVRVEADRQGVAVAYDLAPADGLTVEPPPADEIAEPGSEPTRVPPPELTGPFERVAAGRDGGLDWTLERAPAADGRVCWRFTSTPPVPRVEDLVGDGLYCEAPPSADALLEARVWFVVDSGRDSPVEVVIAVLPPEVVGAELRTADGAARPVPVDRAAGILAVVGPPDPQPVLLLLDLAGGGRLSCGPGPIVEPADLEALEPGTLAAVRDVAWGCFPLDEDDAGDGL